MRILVVDDEVDIREFVQYNLVKEGYEVACATNGREAIAKALEFHPHLILMDMMMPEMDGQEACRALRANPSTAKIMIVFLSAVCEEDSLVGCYDAGADDYITKPVSMKVLCSRVGAICKRIESGDRVVLPKSARLIEERHCFVSDDGDEIRLATKEFEILKLLLSESRIFSREEIFNAVWGADVVVGSRTLDVHIRHLRSKIGENRISTCKGVGFSYIEQD
ncbi:MAG: response regulator transcription factor [Alistipes sp.]|nr:response regulator transcription factor [Alistipes sp.]